MLTRCSYEITWQYSDILDIAANFLVPVGCDLSGETTVSLPALPFFSLDVYTDDTVEVQIQTGVLGGTITTMATLICAPILQHNTIYNLAPPFNRDGLLVLTGNWCQIRVNNTTGNVVDPFHLSARLWR